MNEYGREERQPINAYTLQWQNMNLLEEESSILRFNRFCLVFYFHVDTDCRRKLPWWFLDKRSRSKILTFRTDQIFRDRSGRAQQVAKRHLFTNQCQWTHISRIPIIYREWLGACDWCSDNKCPKIDFPEYGPRWALPPWYSYSMFSGTLDSIMNFSKMSTMQNFLSLFSITFVTFLSIIGCECYQINCQCCAGKQWVMAKGQHATAIIYLLSDVMLS